MARIPHQPQAAWLGIPDSVTPDACVGLRAALRATLSSSPWQRCQFHPQKNAQTYVPIKDLKEKVADQIRRIFNSEDCPHSRSFGRGDL